LKKVHPGDLAGGFSELEMTWLFTVLAPPLETTSADDIR